MTINPLFCTMLAGVLRTRVSRQTQSEASAFGACIAAGLAVQAWTMQGVRSLDKQHTVFEVRVILATVRLHGYAQPSVDEHNVQRIMQHWRRAVERAMNWADDDKQ
jgi:glycerol kinase